MAAITPTTDPIGITILGHGIVGGGVVKILRQQRDLLRQRTGLSFDIRHIVVRDPSKHADAAAEHREAADTPVQFTSDANAAIDDPQVRILVEVMGGTDPTCGYIERALRRGMPVVTANKSLLAARGAELFALARQHDTCIAFEASCGGGIPIIDALQKGLVANRIDALVGIVNGTCNFILTRMTRDGSTYADALRDAQAAGFAEADPTLDVTGRDAAQKLALLASLAFDARVREQDLYVEGIEHIQPADIALARELGYVIKLLAIAERQRADGRGQRSEGRGQTSDANASALASSSSDLRPLTSDLSSRSDLSSLVLRVHPCLVHHSDVLADVSGSFNAISVYGSALGHALFYGRGAGAMPTASAVVADLIGVATGAAGLTFRQLKIFPDTTPPANVLPIEQLRSRYYLRLQAADRPGVLADVTEILGRQQISLSAILQRETDDGQSVPVVITTHRAAEGSMRAALKELDALPTITPPSVCLRIIDQPKEYAEG